LISDDLQVTEIPFDRLFDRLGHDRDLRPFLARQGTERVAAKAQVVKGKKSARH